MSKNETSLPSSCWFQEPKVSETGSVDLRLQDHQVGTTKVATQNDFSRAFRQCPKPFSSHFSLGGEQLHDWLYKYKQIYLYIKSFYIYIYIIIIIIIIILIIVYLYIFTYILYFVCCINFLYLTYYIVYIMHYVLDINAYIYDI